jgi:hypothetical protein
MLARIPAFLMWVFWVLLGVILVILVALVVHNLGGGILNLHLGHFVFRIGVT